MNEPTQQHTSRQLLVSTGIAAAAAAAAILVTVVLPAEYAIDPLHTGALLGLTEMANARIADEVLQGLDTAPAQLVQANAQVMHAHSDKFSTSRVEIRINGQEELEYKALLAAGEPLLYSWTVQGGEVHSEFHGEPTEGDWPKDFYQSYEKVQQTAAGHGSFAAPFTGQHGWYWRNNGKEPVTVVLETSGYYTRIGRIKEGRIG